MVHQHTNLTVVEFQVFLIDLVINSIEEALEIDDILHFKFFQSSMLFLFLFFYILYHGNTSCNFVFFEQEISTAGNP